MVTAYLLPLQTAAFVFPALALLLLVPVAIVIYRRHGVMARWRTLSFYGFVFYLLTALCMTMVPLPKSTANMCVKYAKSAHPQLIPGHTVADVWKEADGQATFGALVLHNSAVIETALNLVLLLPLGVFLRYHFRRGLAASAAIGFGLSLFFELTQLTGLWGIYPCPYRLFDVDDLMANTLGTVIGWAISGRPTRWLPTLETLDARSLARRPVPFGRRALALLLDVVVLPLWTAITVLISVWLFGNMGFLLGLFGAVLTWFVVLPCLTGATPGKRVLLLELVTAEGNRPAPWRFLVRAIVLAVPFAPVPAGLVVLLGELVQFSRSPSDLLAVLSHPGIWTGLIGAHLDYVASMVIVTVGSFLLLIGYAIAVVLHRDHLGVHEILSGVRNRALPHKLARLTDESTADIDLPEPDKVGVS